MTTAAITIPSSWRSRLARVSVFRIAMIVIGIAVLGVVLGTLGNLAALSWDKYGAGIPKFYAQEVFGKAAVRQLILNTAIVVTLGCTLATFIAAILAWLNERTDASIGVAGRFLPLIPFFMPALSFPLGWVFLGAAKVGLLNVALRALVLSPLGIKVDSGPIDIFSWPGLVFLYTVPLTAFASLVISSAMQNVDRGLEEAAKMAGAGPLKILFRIVLPAVRPAMISTFLICLIPAVGMLSIPLVVGTGANIEVVSVYVLELVTTTFPAAYGEAFLIGLMLVIPILLATWIQRRSASGARMAVIGGRASAGARLSLGRVGKIVGRMFFLGYIFVAVVLPLVGLLYVSGVDFWAPTLPDHWNPLNNAIAALSTDKIQRAIMTSVTLAAVTAALLITVAQVLSYGQRLFPRLGRVIDTMAKSPAGVAHVLLAMGILLVFGRPPFRLGGTSLILIIGYCIGYLPYASVVATGAQQQVGSDMLEAGKMAGASEFRIFRSILTPLTRSALVAGLLLVFVLTTGDVNVSLILAGSGMPVVGFVMLDYYEFGGFPQVAAFALLITIVSLCCVAIITRLLGGTDRRRRV